MLLTTCPACRAHFRVQTAQLNVRQGRVMCGRCRHIFNAFETLERQEESENNSTISADAALAEVSAAPDPEGHREPTINPAALDALATSEDAASLSAAPTPVTTADSSIPEPVVAEPMAEPTAITPPTAPMVDASPTQPSATPPPNETASNGDNPLLTSAGAKQRRRQGSVSAWWILPATLAAMGLGAQLIYVFRTEIALQYPAARPVLAAACERLGCTVPWKRDEAAIEIVDSSLIEVPGKPGQIRLTATLVNRSAAKQDYPVLKLELTDSSNQAVVRRMLTPSEYLGREIAREDGLNASGDLYVNLNIDVGNKSRASGYGLKALYP